MNEENIPATEDFNYDQNTTLFETNIDFSEQIILAYLCDLIGLTPNRLKIINNFYDTCKEAVTDNFGDMRQLNLKWLNKFDIALLVPDLIKFQNALIFNKIDIITFQDFEYPASLKVLENFPLVLYYQGNIFKLKDKQCITVVGSRASDLYSQVLLEKILKPACQLGIGVVSGLALGIDGNSHIIAIESGSYTVGVTGSGLDQKSFYPQQNWSLRCQILESGGCVISEYPPNKAPNIYTFPQRNRILAALTEVTWVVQAGLKSGSLITALKARDLGKTLATTPADIRLLGYDGNIKLIKEGCEIITEAEDIISLLGLKIHAEVQPGIKLVFNNTQEQLVYEQLSISPQSVDNLADKFGFDNAQLALNLTMLELSGLALNIGENRWVRK